MKSISHPNFGRTYQIFGLKRTIHFVMEHVPGDDLFSFVAQYEFITDQRGSDTIRSIFQASVTYIGSLAGSGEIFASGPEFVSPVPRISPNLDH